MNERHIERVVAIQPTWRGFGYAVLEGPDGLLDWGIKRAGQDKQRSSLRAARRLVERYTPHAVVLEDPHADGCRRGQRVRELLKAISCAAPLHDARAVPISTRRLRAYFSELGPTTKHEIACAVASRFPELVPRLPPPRRPWMSADERMAIFDAVAFALTHFESPES